MQVLTENYRALDTELNKQLGEARNELALVRERLAHYELLEKELDEAVVSAAEGEVDIGYPLTVFCCLCFSSVRTRRTIYWPHFS